MRSLATVVPLGLNNNFVAAHAGRGVDGAPFHAAEQRVAELLGAPAPMFRAERNR